MGKTTAGQAKQTRNRVQEIGGQSNAYTTLDHTCYYISAASSKTDDCIDLVIPRGGEGLIRRVAERSRAIEFFALHAVEAQAPRSATDQIQARRVAIECEHRARRAHAFRNARRLATRCRACVEHALTRLGVEQACHEL